MGAAIKAATIILQITMCNDCNTFKIWQPYNNKYKHISIRQQHYLQVACNDDGRIALSRRPACMSLYLANGYLLMTEDVLGFATSS